MITIIGSLIFVFCVWAVFSKHFCDGIIAKHFLAFSAITAMLAVLDPVNDTLIVWSGAFLLAALAYWAIKNERQIEKRLRRRHH